MAEKKEGLDFLARLRIRELILMGLILITAVLANLPQDYVEGTLGVDRGMLLAFLGIAVIIGLFLYLRTGLFVVVVLLIAGANMPDQIAEGLNISKIPIVLALVALVGVGLINYVVKLVPTGLEPGVAFRGNVIFSTGDRGRRGRRLVLGRALFFLDKRFRHPRDFIACQRDADLPKLRSNKGVRELWRKRRRGWIFSRACASAS